MALEFLGTALPMDGPGFGELTDLLRIGAAELWAVFEVETSGCGFIPDRRPLILYERHIFSKYTNHQFDANHPDISNQKRGGYGSRGANQYVRLNEAIALDRRAGLRSTSWGIGQVMGFNAEDAGFRDVEEMVAAMSVSEQQQLRAFAGEITHKRLDSALRGHDWVTFARGYNGPAYSENSYDTRLAAAYQKFSRGPLPDMAVRAAQMYLMYLGFDHGPVDGWFGKITRSALNEFQERHGLPITSVIDEELLACLKGEVGKLDSRLPG
jgi:hypothetical protein